MNDNPNGQEGLQSAKLGSLASEAVYLSNRKK